MDNLMWTHSKRGGKVVVYLIAILAAIWVLLPFLWAIINSFKTLQRDIYRRRHHSIS